MKEFALNKVKEKALELYKKAHIILTADEVENMEFAEFGLVDIETTGLQIVVYVNTDNCCAKEMVLLPGQTCPEHMHPPIESLKYPGKEETFRCRYGKVFLYVEGEAATQPKCKAPQGDEQWYTVWHEVKLEPGEQYTLHPGMKHWFQGGPEGAVVSEFSTKSLDEHDVFTNPNIVRVPDDES